MIYIERRFTLEFRTGALDIDSFCSVKPHRYDDITNF